MHWVRKITRRNHTINGTTSSATMLMILMRVDFDPHVHALVADGVFEASGRFVHRGKLLGLSPAALGPPPRRRLDQ